MRIAMRVAASILFVILSLSGCSGQHNGANADYFYSLQNLEKQIDRNFEKQGIYLDSTVERQSSDIRYIRRNYATKVHRLTNVDEARMFYCKFFHDFATTLNSTRGLRPYLHNYPITVKELQLSIAFADDNGELLQYPFIAIIKIEGDTLLYGSYDPLKKCFRLMHEETFSRAYNIYLQKVSGLTIEDILVQGREP
jgi:hypothetical protein